MPYGIVCTLQLCAMCICLVCSCICKLQAKTNFLWGDKVLISSHLFFLITLSKTIVPGNSEATRPFEQILPVGLNIKFRPKCACSSSAAAVVCGWMAGGRSPAHSPEPVCLPQVTATSAWGTRRTSLWSSRPSSSTSRSKITSPTRLQVWMLCRFAASCTVITANMKLLSSPGKSAFCPSGRCQRRENCTFTSAKMNNINLAFRKGLF